MPSRRSPRLAAEVADMQVTANETNISRKRPRSVGGDQIEEVASTSQNITASSVKAMQSVTASAAVPGPVLLDLGSLVAGILIKRPSEHIKSPYVADVQLSNGEMTMAHCPSLDCAGLIKPGKQVLMTPSPAGSKAATSYAVRLVAEAAREGCEPSVVGAHPQLAEQLAQSALSQHLVPELGTGYVLTKQKTYGKCRVDFVLTYDDGSTTLVEVKNVTGADYSSEEVQKFGNTPAKRANQGCYEALPELGEYTRSAVFPHGKAKTGVKVVSTRAIKHVAHLTELHGTNSIVAAAADGGSSSEAEAEEQEQQAQGPPVRCAVLFVVNRNDCERFRPCHEACPLFATVLQRAQAAGVLLLAYEVIWKNGAGSFGRSLPVYFSQQIEQDVDEEWLQRVIAADGNTDNKPPPKGKAALAAYTEAKAADKAAKAELRAAKAAAKAAVKAAAEEAALASGDAPPKKKRKPRVKKAVEANEASASADGAVSSNGAAETTAAAVAEGTDAPPLKAVDDSAAKQAKGGRKRKEVGSPRTVKAAAKKPRKKAAAAAAVTAAGDDGMDQNDV